MTLPGMVNFSLVGGTALSLLFGHRKSVDLDLFSGQPFEIQEIINALERSFGNSFLKRTSNPQVGVFCIINGVKTDLIKHPFPLIRPTTEIEGIRMFSTEDIIAMKVQAVLGRARKKDFWDIAELLNHFSVSDFIQFHKEKYATQNLLVTVPQAISYFADAEDDVDPVSLKGQNWDNVKALISKKVSEFLT